MLLEDLHLHLHLCGGKYKSAFVLIVVVAV